MQLEVLPGYAPGLNPTAGVWRYRKHDELRNVCWDDLPEPRLELGRAVKRLRHKRRVLAGCVAQCGYYPVEKAPAASLDDASPLVLPGWPQAA